jgi:ABC-type glycerol-3-phosphate transport system substrate-binding protein
MPVVRIVLAAVLVLAVGGTAWAQAVPGNTVEERAVNGAKAYLKKHNLTNVEQTILLSSLYRNSFPDFSERWEKLTGIKIKIVPLGYTDIPAKIMAEAVAKTGQFDMFNDFPYTAPDAVGAGVILPLDTYAERGKPDFSGVAAGLRYQQNYQGKLYILVLDGDHLILVLRKDLLDNAQAKAEFRAKFKKDPGCPATMDEWEQMAAFYHTKPVGPDLRQGSLRRDGLPLDQLLVSSLPGLFRGPALRPRHEPSDQHAPRRAGHQAVRLDRQVHAAGHPGLGHAADLSVLGQRPGLLGDVLPVDRRVR